MNRPIRETWQLRETRFHAILAAGEA